MAVDGAELEEWIDPIERHEIHPQGFEKLLQRDLQLSEETNFHMSRCGEHTNIEIRAFGGNRPPPQEAQAVIGAGPEKVDRQESKLVADLVQLVQWCLQFESISNSLRELRWGSAPIAAYRDDQPEMALIPRTLESSRSKVATSPSV